MNFDLLRELTDAVGVAGHEDAVRAVVRDAMAPLVDDIRVDRLGNCIGTRNGSGGPTIMIAAHMDEIGFLVRHVDLRGFLRLQPLGSFDPRVLLAQRAVVHTASGERIQGVIETSVDPLHFGPPTEPRQYLVQDLFLDVGADVAKVEIGDMVTLDRDMFVTSERVISRALDDRLGLYVMIEVMRCLQSRASTIVAVATVQEEVGSRGAVVAGFAVDPDICIAIDLTVANDIPGAIPEEEVTRLGMGPAIKIMDTTQISDPGIVRRFREIAEERNIPLQLEVLNHGGTDASLVQRLRAGVGVVTLSIPARYIHTVNETVAITDVDQTITILAHYLEQAHIGWERDSRLP
jgi:endoglucanase